MLTIAIYGADLRGLDEPEGNCDLFKERTFPRGRSRPPYWQRSTARQKVMPGSHCRWCGIAHRRNPLTHAELITRELHLGRPNLSPSSLDTCSLTRARYQARRESLVSSVCLNLDIRCFDAPIPTARYKYPRWSCAR